MSNRNYYVICDSGCKFPAMTAEQTLAAIAEATGKTGIDCDKAYITQIKEQNANSGLKFWVGTTAEYNALSEKVNNCFYILTDESTATDFNAAVEELAARNEELAAEQIKLAEKVETLSNDYVIETGVTGDWTFRKWESGYCELFATVEIKLITRRYELPSATEENTLNVPFPVKNGVVTAAINNNAEESGDNYMWINRAVMTDDTTVNIALVVNDHYVEGSNKFVKVGIRIDGYIEE